MSFNYIRTREGPNHFVCYYKHQTVLRQDPKDAWRVMSVAKFTDTGKALKEWCLTDASEMGYRSDKNKNKKEGRKDTSLQ